MPNGTVLVVDDDVAVRMPLAAQLAQAQVETFEAGNGAEALEILATRPVDVVVTDLRMPGTDGMQLLQQVVARWPEVPVIMITAHGTVPLAVEAMRLGAADFVLKPFDRDELLYTVRKELKKAERSVSTAPVAEGGPFGESKAMAEVRAVLTRVAPQTATVLLRGENGTGKEVAARWVHELSPRKAGPFVPIHCAALPDTLLESELFGYEKGAFTGAVARKAGRVELADKGTLFLDEIGDVPLSTQVKLLRLIQERELERLGGGQPVKIDVRIIAATHRPLEDMVREGKFREDLYHRLNVVPIVMPPLRDRGGDVSALAQRFSVAMGKANNRPGFRLGAGALASLSAQRWPGNVRELQNFVERLAVLAPNDEVAAEDVERELARGSLSTAPPELATSDLGARRAHAEKDALIEALKRSNNNRTLAARILGISRRTLYNKLAEHGLMAG